MCGGSAPSAAKRKTPAPEGPTELVLDPGQAKAQAGRSKVRALRAGRNALVTPGLSIGAAAGRAVGSSLGIGGTRK